jgi:catechol 2,3-dioxygenase-like lactoylglutathione lyase family enzyme
MARIRRHQFDFIKNAFIHHIGIEVTHLEDVLQFFQSFLGFTLIDQLEYDGERIALLQKDGFQLELVQPLNRQIEQPEYHIAIGVSNINRPMTAFKNSGVWEEPTTYPNGWTSVFMKLDNQIDIEWIETDSKKLR